MSADVSTAYRLGEVERDLLERALAETGADRERLQQTLAWMSAGQRPSDEDLIEARGFFAHVGQLSLTKANALFRGERAWSLPPCQAPRQRPGVKARLETADDRRKKKTRSRLSPLAEPPSARPEQDGQHD